MKLSLKCTSLQLVENDSSWSSTTNGIKVGKVKDLEQKVDAILSAGQTTFYVQGNVNEFVLGGEYLVTIEDASAKVKKGKK